MWVFLFMIKVVNEITPVLNRKQTKKHGPIRIEKQSEETKTAKESVIKVYKPMQSCVESKHSIETPINSDSWELNLISGLVVKKFIFGLVTFRTRGKTPQKWVVRQYLNLVIVSWFPPK